MNGKLKNKKIGIIGGGVMGEALVAGLLQSGACEASNIMVSDAVESRLEFFRSKYGVAAEKDNMRIVGKCEIIVLAVKPQTLPDVLREVGPGIHQDVVVVSIAAGVKLSSLTWWIKTKVVRAMPNICVKVGEGVTALAGTPGITPADREVIQVLFESVGTAVWVDEAQMDAVTAISGSGPAYILLVMEAMIQGGVEAGLSLEQSRNLVFQTVKGTAQMAMTSGENPASLREKIMSPQGTTAAALHQLELGGVRGAFLEAVAAAVRRSKELG